MKGAESLTPSENPRVHSKGAPVEAHNTPPPFHPAALLALLFALALRVESSVYVAKRRGGSLPPVAWIAHRA